VPQPHEKPVRDVRAQVVPGTGEGEDGVLGGKTRKE